MSRKSMEGCRVTPKQAKWITHVLFFASERKYTLKTYCMIKRLVLLATKLPNYYGNGK
jgi:hypothetical protein